ncbi:BON domain-containing protein [Silicimonas algicola]|nr:BON domain-containing protein [Silicimonas algicola]
MRDDDPQQGSSGDYGRSDDGQYDGQLPGRYGQYGGQERGGYGQYGGREQSGSFNQGRGRDYSGRVSSPGHSGGYEVSRRQDPGYRDDDADRGYSSSGGGYSGGGGGTMQGGGQGSRGYGSGAGGAYGGSGYASDFAGGGQPSSGERQNHRGRGPKGYKRSDDRIREDVNDRITDDGSLDASDISVEVSDQEVTLNGTVQTRWEKRRAEDCAESVSGVGHVQNNLRVKSSSDETTASQASSSSDGTKRSR